MPHRFQGLLLDLDGTLIDSAPDLQVAANTVLSDAGRPALPLAAIHRMIGDGMPALIARAFAATGAPAREDEMPQLVRRFVESYGDPGRNHLTTVYPGVAETLLRLRGAGLRLAVCTNKIEAAALDVLQALGLADHVDAVVGADRAPAQKPHPAHLLAALASIGIPREAAAMVGDGPNDVLAARAAGIPVVLVSYGYSARPVEELAADALIDRFSDLPAALTTLRPGGALTPPGPD